MSLVDNFGIQPRSWHLFPQAPITSYSSKVLFACDEKKDILKFAYRAFLWISGIYLALVAVDWIRLAYFRCTPLPTLSKEEIAFVDDLFNRINALPLNDLVFFFKKQLGGPNNDIGLEIMSILSGNFYAEQAKKDLPFRLLLTLILKEGFEKETYPNDTKDDEQLLAQFHENFVKACFPRLDYNNADSMYPEFFNKEFVNAITEGKTLEDIIPREQFYKEYRQCKKIYGISTPHQMQKKLTQAFLALFYSCEVYQGAVHKGVSHSKEYIRNLPYSSKITELLANQLFLHSPKIQSNGMGDIEWRDEFYLRDSKDPFNRSKIFRGMTLSLYSAVWQSVTRDVDHQDSIRYPLAAKHFYLLSCSGRRYQFMVYDKARLALRYNFWRDGYEDLPDGVNLSVKEKQGAIQAKFKIFSKEHGRVLLNLFKEKALFATSELDRCIQQLKDQRDEDSIIAKFNLPKEIL